MERCKRVTRIVSVVLSVFFVSLFALYGIPASAQEVEDDALDENAEAEEAEEIVITGSLIRRKDLTTAAPVSVIEKIEMDAAGMPSIGDILQNLPAQSNGINLQVNNGGDGSTRMNLRGIGSHRTLVLMNGRRMPYGGRGANASVDLNTIPASVIERIEILKDGASSTYGSDAIGGVVNVITRKGFDGVEASIYTGTTERGDGTVYDMSVTAGHKFDRGYMTISGGVFKNRPIWAGNRDWAKYDYQVYEWEKGFDPAECPLKMVGDDLCVYIGGSTGVPQGALIDRLGADGSPAYQHKQSSGFYSFDKETGIRNFKTTGTSDLGAGDYYNYQPENYLMTPQQRFSLFAEGGYEFHDLVKGYLETSYVSRHSDILLAPEPFFSISEGISVSKDNFYNPFDRDFIDIRRRMLEGGHRQWTDDVDTIRVSAGLEGGFPRGLGFISNWHWDLSYVYGRTMGTNTVSGLNVRPRIINALGPSHMDSDGQLHCGTPGNPIDGCVPLDLFGGPGTITQEMMDYIGYTGNEKGYNEMEGVRFVTTGDLVEIPFGGPIGLALGYDYREEFGLNQPNVMVAIGDTTGNKSEPTAGGYFINEVFGELLIPLIYDMPLFEIFEIQASMRYFNYSNFGSDYTWKLGTRWQIIPDISIRGTISTAFRAPSVLQLYSGNYDGFPLANDPCADISGSPFRTNPTVAANCKADGVSDGYADEDDQQRARYGGNNALKPETADIYTAGLVLQPSFVEGLTATLDFWYFKIDKSIQATGINIIFDACYTRTGPDRDFFCDLIHRLPDPANPGKVIAIDYVDDTFKNIGGLDTWGIDFQVKYDISTDDVGRFLWNLEGSYTGKMTQTNGDGSKTDGLGNYDLGAFPEWRFNFGLIWSLDSISATAMARYFGSFKECKDGSCKTNGEYSREMKPNITFDMSLGYAIESALGRTKFTVGVNNILDKDPEPIYTAFTATTDPSAYDFLGRYYYFRLVQNF